MVDLSWSFLFTCTNRITCAFHSTLMHILGMMVCFCTSFELIRCQLQQFSFHCIKKEKGSCFWLLPVSDCCETLSLAFFEYVYFLLECPFACPCVVALLFVALKLREYLCILLTTVTSKAVALLAPQKIQQSQDCWSHPPENSRCTVCAPKRRGWRSAYITAAGGGARNLNPSLCSDRSLCSLSLSTFLFLCLFDIWLVERDGWKPLFRVCHFWDMARLEFDIQRSITISQSAWADISYHYSLDVH